MFTLDTHKLKLKAHFTAPLSPRTPVWSHAQLATPLTQPARLMITPPCGLLSSLSVSLYNSSHSLSLSLATAEWRTWTWTCLRVPGACHASTALVAWLGWFAQSLSDSVLQVSLFPEPPLWPLTLEVSVTLPTTSLMPLLKTSTTWWTVDRRTKTDQCPHLVSSSWCCASCGSSDLDASTHAAALWPSAPETNSARWLLWWRLKVVWHETTLMSDNT